MLNIESIDIEDTFVPICKIKGLAQLLSTKVDSTPLSNDDLYGVAEIIHDAADELKAIVDVVASQERTAVARLRAENQELKNQLQDLRLLHFGSLPDQSGNVVPISRVRRRAYS